MEKCGVPPKLLSIVKSFHEEMQAKVGVEEVAAEHFEFQNGLRQGCTLSPILFNIYISAVVTMWRNRHEEAGVAVLYIQEWKEVGG